MESNEPRAPNALAVEAAPAAPRHSHGVVKLMKNKTATLVCIPKPFSRALQWHAGDQVLITLVGNKLVVTNLGPHLNAVSAAAAEVVGRG